MRINTEGTKVPLTAAYIVCDALGGYRAGDLVDKLARADLATRIMLATLDADSVHLTEREVQMIKTAVDAIQTPLFIGQIFQILDE